MEGWCLGVPGGVGWNSADCGAGREGLGRCGDCPEEEVKAAGTEEGEGKRGSGGGQAEAMP